MYFIERMLVDEEYVARDDTYNLKLGGSGGFDFINEYGLNTKNHDYKTICKTMNKASIKRIKFLRENDKEWVRKISLSRSKIMKAWLENGGVPSFFGKTHSNEAKRKIGEKAKIRQSGEKNSQYGKMWIYNLELKENKTIPKGDLIPDGWVKGRKLSFEEKVKIKKCKVCGQVLCIHPNICKNSGRLKTFIKYLSFNENFIGTLEFYKEYKRCEYQIKNDYYDLKLSVEQIKNKYGFNTNETVRMILKSFGCQLRTLSEAGLNFAYTNN
jgi:hypothetical protein